MPEVRAIRGRNYSLSNTLHPEATILGVLSANLTLGLLPTCPSLGRNLSDCERQTSFSPTSPKSERHKFWREVIPFDG